MFDFRCLTTCLILCLPLTMFLATPGLGGERRKPHPYDPIEDDPKLPRVLLIGDSISIGYTTRVRKRLAGVANVHRAPDNCGPTTKGLANIDKWLGEGKWDVIHFNWGLHDMKYLKYDKQADPAKDTPQVPIDQYEKNLRELVGRLKKTGAKLIWAATTPVPAGTGKRVKGDAARYNAVAEKIVQADRIAINDLYAFALPQLDKIQKRRDVHFTGAGSGKLAKQVARHIRQALASVEAKESPDSGPRQDASPVDPKQK